LGSIIKGATARSQVVSRSTVSASKLTYFALKIASVWIARISKGVKKEKLFSKGIIKIPFTCSKQQMQQ
jgi:ligand-binding SRPBCC domain-containing protein